ncbi:MAG TPA: hypothetical protein PKA27_03040 [Fimbriimonadaceae bacterium]|nr:hypothetical protein [Fimbriimonadaceae bacterium]
MPAGQLLLLAGKEPLLRLRALAELVPKDNDDFDTEVFVADESEPVHWLASVGTAPFLAEYRTVIVRNLTRVDPADANFNSAPGAGRLILVADDERGDDSAQKKFDRHLTGWSKIVTKLGGKVESFEVTGNKAHELVSKEAAAAGKTISKPAIDALLEITGGSLSRSLEEMEKVVLYVGKATEIRENDVRAVAIPSKEFAIFSMVNSLVSGSPRDALSQLKTLAVANPKSSDVAFSSILPMVSRQLRLLWQARVCIDAGTQPRTAPESIYRTFPDTHSIIKQSDNAIGMNMRMARNVDLDQIEACLQILADTDGRLKGLLPAYSTSDTLERMVLEMAEAVKRR